MKRLAIAALLWATPAMAQTLPDNCYQTPEVFAKLQAAGEQQIGMGVDKRGFMLTLWMKPDQTTWTILITGPEGISCIASYGEDWQPLNVDQRT